jgi:uncharacterized membrane protein YfcA
MSAVPLISSMNLTKYELIQALGPGFNASYSKSELALSILAVAPAMLGMYVGQKTRDGIEPNRFRQVFFGALFILGAYMAVRAGYGLIFR